MVERLAMIGTSVGFLFATLAALTVALGALERLNVGTAMAVFGRPALLLTGWLGTPICLLRNNLPNYAIVVVVLVLGAVRLE